MAYDKEAWLKRKGEEVETALQAIKDGVANLVTSGDWKKFLDVQATFHKYSFRNTLLIISQCPNATRVAGKGTWRKLGRKVTDWEARIAILAPYMKKWKESDESGEEVQRQALIGWKTVYVYDASATEGDDLPSIATFVEGNAEEDLLSDLIKAAECDGISVEFMPIDGATGGFIERDGKKTTINSNRDVNHQAKTMIHEMAHGILHCDKEENHTRSIEEVEAESVAYVVCKALGIDTECYSFGYVTKWSGGDCELVEKTGSRIAKAAKQILSSVGDRIQGSEQAAA